MARPLIRDIFVKKQIAPSSPSSRESPKAIRRPSPFKKEAEALEPERKLAIKAEKLAEKFKILKFSSKFKIILGIVILAGLAAVGFILLSRFSSVIIEITPRQEFIDIDAIFNAGIKPQKNELPLEVMQLNYSEKATGQTTGVKQISRKASGQIVIYSAYSSSPQSLIKNTRFQTPDGKIYRIDKVVTIPGVKIEEGKMIPAEIEVTVYADKPGEEYNIGLTDFIIPGFQDPEKREKIYGRSKTEMKGGFVGEVPTISESDLNNLRSFLKEKVKEYLLKMARNPKPDDFLFYDGAKEIVFDKEKEGPKVGDEGKQFEISESAALFGFLLRKSDLNKALAEKYFNPEIAPQAEIVNLDKLSFILKNFAAEQPEQITLSLKGQGRFVSKINEDSLKRDLINEGKNPNAVFGKYSAIERARIVFRPGWWRFFPKNPGQITIKKILDF